MIIGCLEHLEYKLCPINLDTALCNTMLKIHLQLLLIKLKSLIFQLTLIKNGFGNLDSLMFRILPSIIKLEIWVSLDIVGHTLLKRIYLIYKKLVNILIILKQEQFFCWVTGINKI